MSLAMDVRIGLYMKVKDKRNKYYFLVKAVLLYFVVKDARITGNLKMARFARIVLVSQKRVI